MIGSLRQAILFIALFAFLTFANLNLLGQFFFSDNDQLEERIEKAHQKQAHEKVYKLYDTLLMHYSPKQDKQSFFYMANACFEKGKQRSLETLFDTLNQYGGSVWSGTELKRLRLKFDTLQRKLAKADSLIDAGDYSLARITYFDLKSRFPQFSKVHYGLALTDWYSGYYKSCKEHLEKCMTLIANYPNAWRLLGKYHYRYKDYSKAIKAYDTAIKYQPKNPENHFLKAIACLKVDSSSCIIKNMAKAIDITDTNPDYYHLKGIGHKLKDEKYKAWESYDKAIALDSNHYKTLGAKYNLFGYYGDYGLAIEMLDRMIDLKPNKPELYYKKGSMYYYWDDFNDSDEFNESPQREAIKSLTKAIELTKDSAKYFRRRGKALKSVGSLDSALKDFNKAIALDPYNLANYESIHWIYFTARNEKMKAKKLRERCFDTFSNKYKRSYKAADAYFKAGKCLDLLPFNYKSNAYYKEVVDNYKKALKIDPDNPDYLSELGIKYSLLDSNRKVIKVMKKLLKIEKKPLYYTHLASAYEDLGKPEKSVEVYNTAIEAFPSRWRLFRNRSDLYEEMGKKELARKDRKKVDELLDK